MPRNRLAEHLMAGLLAVLMVLWLWQASRLPYTVAGRPGPGFFPVWLSAIGLTLSLVVLVAGIRTARQPRPDGEPPNPEDDPRSRRTAMVRLLAALLGAVAFLMLMPILGFIVGLALYLAYLCLAVTRIRVVSAIALSQGTAAAIYLVFAVLLEVPFPTGLLGV